LRAIAHRAGYSVSHVQSILTGRGRPSEEAVAAVAGALGASPDEIRRAAFYASQIRPTELRATPSERPAAARAVPRELPYDIRDFTGRQMQLARLEQLLDASGPSRGAVVISAIDGAAGVGKTALAVHFAHQAADRFPDGQLHVNLHGYDPHRPPSDPTDVLDGFLRALGADPSQIPASLDDRVRLYRSMLADRRVLLLLDNAAAADQVRPLLPANNSCLALVTSRNQLSGLTAGDGAARLTVDVLTKSEAVALLSALAGRDRVTAEADNVYRLVRLVGGLPLALRILGERLANRNYLTVADLLNELADERDRLDFLQVEGDDNLAIRSVFSWSYRNLTPAMSRSFRLLSLHAGTTFSTEAASVLVGGPLTETRHVLDSLSAVSMLEPIDRDRYRFHDLLRVYAREKAEADETPESRLAAVRRLLTWYVHRADEAGQTTFPGHWNAGHVSGSPRSRGHDHTAYTAAVRWCEAERASLLAAAQQAAEYGEDRIAWQLPNTLIGFYWLRKHWRDWIAAGELSLAAARRLHDPLAETVALTFLGNAYQDCGREADALKYYDPALERWRSLGDPVGEAGVLANIGVCKLRGGRPSEALELCQRAVILARDNGAAGCEGFSLLCLGTVHRLLNQHHEVVRDATCALDIWRTIENRYGEAWALQSLGTAYRHLGEPDRAVLYCTQAAALRHDIADRKGEAASLISLGRAYRDSGDEDGARDAWMRALDALDARSDAQTLVVRSLLTTNAVTRPHENAEPDQTDRETEKADT
jgi:tetratricopeptide (TPR) repeat protein/transcriptional regulator with XRE-family HTH domain